MRALSFLLLVLVTASCNAQPDASGQRFESIDCSKVTISPELDDCIKKKAQASNSLLAAELMGFEDRTRRNYAADLKLGNALINKVKEAQKAWVSYRDKNCPVEAFEIEEGTPAYITTVNSCIIRMNDERIKVLKKL